MPKLALEHREIGRINDVIAIQILVGYRWVVRHKRTEGGFECREIGCIYDTVIVEVRIADITVAIPIGITLAVATGVWNQWPIGSINAIVLLIWLSVMVAVVRDDRIDRSRGAYRF